MQFTFKIIGSKNNNNIELLKYNDSLKKQNKFLKYDNKLKYLELRNYSVQINEHLHWYNKEQYLKLMAKYSTVNFVVLLKLLKKKYRLLTKNREILKNIKLSSISSDFAM